MFGPFRITNPLSGGLLWKIPWRMSKFQKRRHRMRMRAVDSVVATVDAALSKQGQTLEALQRWKAEMPTEAEMLPKDKYTMFARYEKSYRKGIHSMFFCSQDPLRFCRRANLIDRTAQVDESITKSQPPGVLRRITRAKANHQIPRKGHWPVAIGCFYCTTCSIWERFRHLKEIMARMYAGRQIRKPAIHGSRTPVRCKIEANDHQIRWELKYIVKSTHDFCFLL